jgi:hypothetical protein
MLTQIPALLIRRNNAGDITEELPVLVLAATHSGLVVAPQVGPVEYVVFGNKRLTVEVRWNAQPARSPLQVM